MRVLIGVIRKSFSLNSQLTHKFNNIRVLSTTNMGENISPDSVFDFWFPKDATVQEKFKNWFGGGPEYDEEIKRKFGDLVLKARNGELSSWEDPNKLKHSMAFIILLDQFCRNIYRGTADMYSHDHKSLDLALKIIDLGNDKKLSFEERFFLYLPLEHHEDKDIQAKCLAKYEEGAKEAVEKADRDFMEGGIDFAKKHKAIIDEFGRFPKRNAILGRQNTPKEEEALKNWKFSF